MSISNDNGDDAVTIGVAKNIEATVRIANTGTEPAYNAKLIVKSDLAIRNPRSQKCTLSSDNPDPQVRYTDTGSDNLFLDLVVQ